MRAASAPAEPARLLVIDPARGVFDDARPADLARLFAPGDLLVVNDAAVLPASFAGTTKGGAPVEVRLLGPVTRAFLLGKGDWHTRTENRPAPPALAAGDAIDLGAGFRCWVASVSEVSPRLVTLRFDREGAALYRELYARGRPIQYAHVPDPLELWSVQTGFATRPWAVEMPSAARPLRFELLLELARNGVRVATLTHAASVSATGDPAIDALLPLPECFEIPEATVAAVAATRARGGRVVAVGTSVVRALEGAFANGGVLRAGPGETNLVVRQGFRLRVVSALLTGMHERDASHFQLLQAFAPPDLLDRAYAHAEVAGYLGHEFGDATVILPAVAVPDRGEAAKTRRREGASA